jgi:hypothetical protein
MAIKSLLSQARQIKSSKTFGDIALGDVNSDRQTLAEGQDYLEQDMNVLRSMILDITGETVWSDKPAVTLADAAGSANKLILQPVQAEVTGVDGTSVVTTIDVAAGITNNTGTTDIGYIVDDAETPAVGTKARVTLRDKATNQILVNADEKEIYGVASNDGADKLQIKFYTDVDGTATEQSVTGDIEIIAAYREKLADINEEALLSNAGFAGAVGAFEIGDRVYVDVDQNGNPIFGFVDDENITATINKIAGISGGNKKLGDNVSAVSGISSDTYNTTFATDGANYLADEDTLIEALMKLDAEAKVLEDAVANASGDEVSEILSADLAEGDAYTIPDSKTYKNDDKDAITVFVNGQKLANDLVIGDGSAGNGDYTADSTTTIKFAMPLEISDLVTCVITKA